MAADNIKDALPYATNGETDQIDGQEIKAAVQDIRPEASGVTAEMTHDGAAPAGRAGYTHGLQDGIGLIAGIPEGHKDAGNKGDNHHNHYALQVDAVTDVRRGGGGFAEIGRAHV